jgi:hypothetical protein
MAEIAVTVYDPGRLAASGANYTDNKTAATSGNNYTIPNNGRVLVVLECTGGGTAAFVTQSVIDGLAVTDLTVTTTAAKIQLWGPFPPDIYGTTLVTTVSAATNLFAVRC